MLQRLHLEKLADFSNLVFAFFGFQIFNGPFLFLTKWSYIAIYTFFLVGNAYVCYNVVRMKKFVIKRVLDGFDRRPGNNPDLRPAVEAAVQQHLQWGDLGELAFGKLFGRFVIECSLFIAVFTAVVGQMFGLHLTLVETVYRNNSAELDISNISTTLASSECPSDSFVVQFRNLSTYVAIFLPVLSISALFPGYRTIGFICFVGFAFVCSQQFLVFFIPIFLNNSIDYTAACLISSYSDKFIWTMSCVPQLAAIMMTLHGSLKSNSRYFGQVIRCAAVLSGVPILLAIFSWCRNDSYGDGTSLEELVTRIFYENVMWLRPQLSIVLVALCFLMNFPLSHIIERRLARTDGQAMYLLRDYEDYESSMNDLEFFDPAHRDSVFEQLRNNPEARLWTVSIFLDLEIKTAYWKKILIRLLLILSEFGITVLSVKCAVANKTISYLEATSGAFFGFVIPCAIYFRLHWTKIPSLEKIFSVCIAAIAVMLSYLAAFNQIATFSPLLPHNLP